MRQTARRHGERGAAFDVALLRRRFHIQRAMLFRRFCLKYRGELCATTAPDNIHAMTLRLKRDVLYLDLVFVTETAAAAAAPPPKLRALIQRHCLGHVV